VIPAFIQAVPWWPERTANAVALARQTQGRIVWDTDHSAFDTHKDLLAAMGDGPGLMLEDDVDLAPDWRRRVEEVIAVRPRQVVRFYSSYPDDATLGSRSLPGKEYAMNLCTYLPATYAATLLRWMGDRRPRAWLDYHDFVLGQWLDRRHEEFWNHVPSLVQHRRGRSLVKPGRSMNRQSGTFA
jgi:hypothetical protein